MVALMALVTLLVVYCGAFNIRPTIILDLFVCLVTENIFNAPLWLFHRPKASLDDGIFLIHHFSIAQPKVKKIKFIVQQRSQLV